VTGTSDTDDRTVRDRQRPWGVGIVGCGVIAPTHAQAIATLANARLVAVYDVIADKARSFASRFSTDVASSLEDLLARPDVEVVAVCVPSGLHAEIGVAAARAGKHVIVEKPIDVTVEAADRLIEGCRAAGVKLTVISQHRYDPGVQRARELIANGRLGRLVLGDAVVKWYRSQGYYDSGDWRGTWALDGGGALMNQGVHYVDLLRWLMGPVVEVTALCATQSHTIEVEDVALALLRFESGAVGLLEASTSVFPGLPERLEISGTHGTIIVEAGELRMVELIDERPDVGAYGRPVRLGDRPVATGAADPAAIPGGSHTTQIADFLSTLETDRTVLMTGEEGRESLAVIRAVYDSAQAGRPVRPAPPRSTAGGRGA